MAGRGSSPPLFELLGRSTPHEPTRAADRASVSKPKGTIEPSRARPESHQPVERIRQVGAASIAGGTVRLPVSYLYIALAAISLALILVWAVAFKLGGNATERDLVQGMSRPAPTITTDPLSDPEPRILAPPESDPVGTIQPAPQIRPGTPSARPGGILTATGPVADDPREPGLNFLVVESNMERGEAERLVVFLSNKGQAAIGVQMLDRGGQPTNNPPRYQIVLTRGFPGRGFGDSKPVRDSIVSDVKRLGTTWQREFKGSTRLASPLWTKYSP